ncbi:DUF6415 family natural product biosynthesis protein [Streptomyces wedmorensis]
MTDPHVVLCDPEGRLDTELPLDRELHKCLVKAVLGWTGNLSLPPADLQQIALLLTGTARAVAADVRRAAGLLPEDHAARALADVVLEEADRRLSVELGRFLAITGQRFRAGQSAPEMFSPAVDAAWHDLLGDGCCVVVCVIGFHWC